MSGKLYLVATPIGNLGDMTFRAVQVLKDVDLIAAEDTRRARKLLTHYEIKGHLISYHSHNERQKTDDLLNRVENGENIALVTDAGMPCIADPGFFIARAAIARGIEPEIIPGVSASTFAVAAAGVPVDKFYFAGEEHQVIIIREATKLHEERIRMSAGEMLVAFKDRNWKGEFVVIIPRNDK